MTIETLRLTRDILLRIFIIGFVFALLLGLVTMVGWNTWLGLAGDWFQTDPATLTPLVLKFFLNVRFFLLFLILAPALAIHWTLRKEQARKKK